MGFAEAFLFIFAYKVGGCLRSKNVKNNFLITQNYFLKCLNLRIPPLAQVPQNWLEGVNSLSSATVIAIRD